jgi:hypothetical protein
MTYSTVLLFTLSTASSVFFFFYVLKNKKQKQKKNKNMLRSRDDPEEKLFSWGPPEESAEAIRNVKNRSAWEETRRRYHNRLTLLFTVRCPHKKTQEDVEEALTFFSKPDSGGWEEMMKQATQRFGPEPNEAEVRRAFWKRKLTAYFVLVNADQSAEDVEECLDYFEDRVESFEGMWTKVQRKYGYVVDKDNQRVQAEEARFRGGVVVERPPNEVLAGLIRGRVVIMVVVTGIPYRSYHEAPQVSQFRLNSAIASEIKYCAEFPNPLIVVRVAEHVEGLFVELETECPEGSARPGSLLVHHVNGGAFPTGLIRTAVVEFLEGSGVNPARVFVQDAAVSENRTTANFSGSVNLRMVDSVNVGGAASARKQYKLPSISESRELVQARKDMLGANRLGFVIPNAADLEQSSLAAADTILPKGAATTREYPPPVSAYLAPASRNNTNSPHDLLFRRISAQN